MMLSQVPFVANSHIPNPIVVTYNILKILSLSFTGKTSISFLLSPSRIPIVEEPNTVETFLILSS